MRYRLIIAAITGLFLLAGCERESSTAPENTPSNPAVKLSKFSEIQSRILTPNCAVSGCHTGNNPPQSLDMSAGKAYGNLVGVPSRENPAMLRVQPGNSSMSFLMKKLRGDGTSQMPPSGALSASLIDSVAKWIDQGAAND